MAVFERLPTVDDAGDDIARQVNDILHNTGVSDNVDDTADDVAQEVANTDKF
jgi:hypothetical protein